MSAVNYERVLREVTASMECSLCTRLPVSFPVFACKAGHLVCQSCKPSVDRCCTCDKDYVETPNKLSEQIIKMLPRPCKFAENGCIENLLEVQLEEHEAVCLRRRVACVHPDCKQLITVKHLAAHVLGAHIDVQSSCSEGKRSFVVKFKESHFSNIESISPKHIRCEGFDFFIVFSRNYNRSTWFFWVYIVGTKMDADKFKVIGSEKIRFGDSPISVDIPRAEVRNSGLTGEMTDARLKRLLVDGKLRCDVGLELKNKPQSGLRKFFSRIIKNEKEPQ